MPPKVRDLEIIYNIKWKNKSTNGGDKAIVLGMYDIPATTLSWAVFKTYLLKNSGTVADGEDARVFYVTDNKTEFPIDSQIDFQIALYAFRRKARMGDIVNLRLERVIEEQQQQQQQQAPVQQNSQKSNSDVETQIDNTNANTTCCTSGDTAPEWFLSYMKQFKNDFTNEMKTIVSEIVENRKPSIQPSNVKVKYRQQVKNARKLHTILPENTCEIKETPKLSSRAEVKLERKLEKLEQKSKMIKERKQALLNYTANKNNKENDRTKTTKDNNNDLYKKPIKETVELIRKTPEFTYRKPSILTIHCVGGDSESDNDEENEELMDKSMDACMTDNHFVVPRFSGGETYIHYWEVKNIGSKPWDKDTVLEFAWGSKALEPLDKVVEVPHLEPNRVGIVKLRLKIPKKHGNYETYWNFMHKNRRFGHWLGCHITVEPPKVEPVQIMNDPPYEFSPILDKRYGSYVKPSLSQEQQPPEEKILEAQMVRLFRTIATNVREADLGLEPEEDDIPVADKKKMMMKKKKKTSCSSNSSTSDSDSSSNKKGEKKEDFVVVPIPECFKVDEIPKINSKPKLENVEEPEKLTTNKDVNDEKKSTTNTTSAVENIKLINKIDDIKDVMGVEKQNNEKVHSVPSGLGIIGGVGSHGGSGAAYYLDDPHIGNQSGDAAVLSYLNEFNSNDYPFMVLNDAKYPIAEMKSEYLTRYNNITASTSSITSSANTQNSTKTIKSTTNNINDDDAGVDDVVDDMIGDDIDDDDDDEDDASSSDSTNCASGSSTIEIITAKDIAQAMMEEENKAAVTTQPKENNNENNNDDDMKKTVIFDCGAAKQPTIKEEVKVIVNPATSTTIKPTTTTANNNSDVMNESTSDDAFKSMPSLEADYNSHCSAVGSCFSDENNMMMLSERNNISNTPSSTSAAAAAALRTFIFPQDLPGYEVIQSGDDINDAVDNTNEVWLPFKDEHAKFEMEQNQKIVSGPPPLNLSMHDRNPFNITPTTPNDYQQQQQPTSQVSQQSATPVVHQSVASTASKNAIIEEQPMPTWAMPKTEPITTSTYSTAAAALAAMSSGGGTGRNNVSTSTPTRKENGPAPTAPPTNVHILPETLVSGAVSVASSAINTARSVFGMIVPQEIPQQRHTQSNFVVPPQPGRWVNGHWVSNNPETKREANLQALAEMGFWNRDLNATLLARYNDDLSRVVAELVQ